MAEGGDRKAAKMLRMVTEPTGFLSTIQICITLAGFLGSAFAADNFSDKLVNWLINDCGVSGVSPSALDTISVIIITLVLSYFTLVLGELVPKRIAMKRPEGIARAVSGLMIGMTTVLRPAIWLLTVSTNGVLRLCGIDPKDNAEEVSEEEIIMMLDEGEEAGSIESGEKELIKNVFSLNDTTAEDVMVHRSQVAFLKRDDARTTLLNEIAESGYSRFPVYGRKYRRHCRNTLRKDVSYRPKQGRTVRNEGFPDATALCPREHTHKPHSSRYAARACAYGSGC